MGQLEKFDADKMIAEAGVVFNPLFLSAEEVAATGHLAIRGEAKAEQPQAPRLVQGTKDEIIIEF